MVDIIWVYRWFSTLLLSQLVLSIQHSVPARLIYNGMLKYLWFCPKFFQRLPSHRYGSFFNAQNYFIKTKNKTHKNALSGIEPLTLGAASNDEDHYTMPLPLNFWPFSLNLLWTLQIKLEIKMCFLGEPWHDQF